LKSLLSVWTEAILSMAIPWWQHHKHCCVYYYITIIAWRNGKDVIIWSVQLKGRAFCLYLT